MSSQRLSGRVYRVRAPSRLHLGFADMHGGLGRRFGGVGAALTEPCLELSMRPSSTLEVAGEGGERVRAVAEHFLQIQKDVRPARIEIHRMIPQHCGFGSGTQTALAVAHGLAHLSDLDLPSRDIMRIMGRGRRSGVGVAAFEFGGVVIDGGKGAGDDPPPLLARFAPPKSWCTVLVIDEAAVGVHGATESGAFDRLPGFSSSCAGYLSRVLLMELLPGVAEGDFSAFADATMRLQDCIGDYFASVQGGRYTSPKVGRVLEYLRESGVKGIGQSSWGPTGFAFAPDEEYARRLIRMAGRALAGDTGVRLSLAGIDGTGADISE